MPTILICKQIEKFIEEMECQARKEKERQVPEHQSVYTLASQAASDLNFPSLFSAPKPPVQSRKKPLPEDKTSQNAP